jgi:osmotically-inducible protein OsmY
VAAKRVVGVVAVANDIEVRVPTLDERPDPEIAREVVDAIRSHLPTSWEHIKVIVKNCYINLEGEVEWQYQRETAEAAARGLQGVKGVTKLIEIRPHAVPDDVKRRIEAAFKHNAEIDARHIVVEISGSQVILKGKVRSWAEREEAERVAWAAPGVTDVDDHIVVSA